MRRRRRGYAGSVWWFVLPAAALYLFAVLVPSLRGTFFAFTDWDGVTPNPSGVGFAQSATPSSSPSP
jgi:raffinose/stachyose/melibiose transport system permease protein